MKISDSIKNYGSMKRRLVLDGLFTGILAGFFAIIFRMALARADILRNALYSDTRAGTVVLWIGGLILIGLIIGRILQGVPLSAGSGIPQVQGELLGFFEMKPLRILAAKISGGVLATLAGLSLGREGPSIQIGAAAGKLSARILKRDTSEENYMISAGASAGLAAAFNAPLAGTLFTLEEMHRNFSPLLMVPSLIAAVTADFMAKYIFGLDPVFHFQLEGPLPLGSYHTVLLLGGLAGLIGVAFIKTITFFQDRYQALPLKSRYWPLLAILIMAAVGYLEPELLGGGHSLVENAALGSSTLRMLFLIMAAKLIVTGLSYGSKAQGGIFMPVLVIGGILGVLVSQGFARAGIIPDAYQLNFVVLGMAGILTSVVRSPVLSIILVTEMTGSFQHILPITMVAVTAYLVAELLKVPPIYEILLERMTGQPGTASGETEGDRPVRIIQTLRLPPGSMLAGRKISELELPGKSLIVSVARHDEEIIPHGDTELRAEDEITLIIEKKELSETRSFIES